MLRKTACISISPKSLKLNRESIIGVCPVDIPSPIQNLLNVTGTTIPNNFTASYGAAPRFSNYTSIIIVQCVQVIRKHIEAARSVSTGQLLCASMFIHLYKF